jgi:hypothetical protein
VRFDAATERIMGDRRRRTTVLPLLACSGTRHYSSLAPAPYRLGGWGTMGGKP